MNVWLFPAALLALVLTLCLRTPVKSSFWQAFGLFTVGLVGGALAVKAIAQSADIGRPTDFDYFVADAARVARQDSAAPLIVFNGASFSRNAVDPELMTQLLREQGYPHRAINLSLQGSSLQERHANLLQFIDQAGRAPEVAFLGVAREFDARSAYAFGATNAFSERAIAQFTPEAAVWAGMGLAGGACEGAAGCVKDVVLSGAHLLMNFFNVGLFAGGEELASLEPRPSFDPRTDASTELTAAEISEGVLAETIASPLRGVHWAASFQTAPILKS